MIECVEILFYKNFRLANGSIQNYNYSIQNYNYIPLTAHVLLHHGVAFPQDHLALFSLRDLTTILALKHDLCTQGIFIWALYNCLTTMDYVPLAAAKCTGVAPSLSRSIGEIPHFSTFSKNHNFLLNFYFM